MNLNTPNDNPQDDEVTAGKHISYWTDSVSPDNYSPLKENFETDVVIVGGGLAGVSTAYCLARSGKKVVLVEDGNIGSGETGRTTAHLVTALDDRYYDLQKIFGEEKTRLIAESHRSAIDFVEEVVKTEAIDCGFERVNGFLFLHPSDKPDSLDKELEAAINAGVQIELINEIPGLTEVKSGLRFLNQGQFHPLKFTDGVCKAIIRMGGKIYTGTHAAEISEQGIVTSDGFTVNAKHVVVATNSPVNNLFVTFGKQYAYRTYVIGALVAKGKLPKALWWDTGDFDSDPQVPPYHYIRVHPYNDQFDLLIAGGEDHPTGDISKTGVSEQNRYKLVENWTRRHFPIGEIIYRWSGQVMEPMDGVAFIGRNPHDKENIYIITGDSGNGMTHCTFAGLLITDLINGVENKFEKLYDPGRFSFSQIGSYLKHSIKDKISFLGQLPNFNDTSELDNLKNGEGRIVDMLEEKFGAYRDKDGRLSIVSAQCTHIKCSVAWNADELSWDCPCHGSRFTYDGKVINGPANVDLPSYALIGNKLEKK